MRFTREERGSCLTEINGEVFPSSVFTSPLTLPPILFKRNSLFKKFFITYFCFFLQWPSHQFPPKEMFTAKKNLCLNHFPFLIFLNLNDLRLWCFCWGSIFAFLLKKFCCSIWNVATFQFLFSEYFQSQNFYIFFLSIFWGSKKFYRIIIDSIVISLFEKQIQITIWWWDEQACLNYQLRPKMEISIMPSFISRYRRYSG